MNRVARYHSFGPPLEVIRIEEEQSPTPAPGEVVLGMEAACLHLADVYRVTGIRDFSFPPPGIPGAEGFHEFSVILDQNIGK